MGEFWRVLGPQSLDFLLCFPLILMLYLLFNYEI